MKRILMAVLALSLLSGVVGVQAQERDRDRERELREQLRDLQRQMRDIQRELGEATRFRFVEPLIMGFGNRARLGVVVNTARDEETDDIGAVLQAVTPDGPADDAGLESGDIIISVNGEPLTETQRWQTPGDKLIKLARELDDGDTVEIEYQRDGQRMTTTITARRVAGSSYAFTVPDFEFPGITIDTLRIREFANGWADRAREVAGRLEVRSRGGPFVVSLFGARWADMELVTIDDALGSYFGTTEGLLVVRAPRDDLLNLQSGDVLLRIGGRTPNSPSHAMRILRSYEPGDEVRIDIMRNRARQTLTATVPERDRGLHEEEQS